MNKLLFSYIILALLFLSLIPSFSPFSNDIVKAENNWIIEGNKVYVDDPLVYASATPHTISGSGDVVFEFKSKVYTGNVDFIWGFYQEIMRPTAIWLWQNYTHSYNVQEYEQDWGSTVLNSVTSFASLGIQNYDLYTVTLGNKNNTYLYQVNYDGNKTGIYAFTTFSNVGSTYTLSGNYSHWVNVAHSSTYPDWNSWTSPYTKLNFNYGGMNTWYLYPNQPIVADTIYKCKIRIEQRFGVSEYSGKYWFAFKPSTETLGEAIANNHFYALDPWFNTSWSMCKRIVINHDLVAGNLTNFPILFDNTSTSFKTYAQPDGDDFVFVKPDNITRYNHEIESYNSTTGRLIAWVNITSLSSVTDTVLYLYYGNSGCTNQQNIVGTWDANYKAVYHFNESGTGLRYDSTSNNYDMTTVNYEGDEKKTGKVGNADEFDGTDDYLVYGASTSNFLDSASGTYEVWIEPDVIAGTYMGLISKYRESSGGWVLSMTAGTPSALDHSYWNTHWHELETVKPFVVDTWCYVAATRGASGQIHYANGALFSNNSLTDAFVEHALTGYFAIGVYHTNPAGHYFNGIMDEVRVSLAQRSAQWINTTYNTTHYKSTFLTVGSTTSTMVTAPTDLTVTAHTNTTLSLSWTKGTNQTVILRNTTGYSTSYKWGTIVYNGTLQVYTDTLLTAGKKYYYRAWNFNPYTKTFSTNYTSANGSTNPNPPYNAAWNQVGSSINITWLNGTGSMKTVVRMSSTTQPILPQDGTEIYNGTLKYKVQAVTGSFYITLFSFNTTTGLFSSPGVNLTSYFLFIRCYNESSTLPVTGYSVFFTNPAGTETYMHDGCTNPHIVNTTIIPQGNDISVMVNATGYYARTYVMDIIITGNYYFSAYLVPITTATLYNLRVLNEVTNPIEGVTVTIKRYINATVGYQTVSTLLTDSNGFANLQLIPYVQYKVFCNKTGYVDTISDYIPAPPNLYGQTETKDFLMHWIEVTPINYIEIVFTGVASGNKIYANYTDIMDETINATILLYQVNNTNGNLTLVDMMTYGATNSINYVYIGYNSSYDYKIMFFFNHTSYGQQTRLIIIEKIKGTITTPNKINTLLTLIIGPAGPFFWQNLIMFLFFLVMMFAIDKKDAGKGLVVIGGIFVFVSMIGFIDVFSTGARMSIPTLFIIVGLLLEWINAKRNG
jgi:hypothetical protein